MSEILHNAEKVRLPACLQTRQGWGRWLEMNRSQEPRLHQIEPTNHCPYSCIMCPRSKMKRKQGFMEWTVYEKVMEEVATYSETVRSKEIELYHFGESFLHPDLDKMIGYASQKGLKSVLSVNAPQLTPEVALRILEKRPYKIIISLDGYDSQSYMAIRGKNASFEKAVENIDEAIAIHKKIQSETQISVCMIKMHLNESHIDTFKKFWEAKGIAVDIREFFAWGDKKMTELGDFHKYPPQMPCPFPWQYLVVQWNGDVVPCCRDYDGINVMGNVKENSLKEIWNGSSFTEFRKRMATGHYDPRNTICQECLSIYFTE